SSLQASEAPVCVGAKNGLVVTWLTNVNLYDPLAPKMLAALEPLAAWLELELEPPQASRIIAATPAAPPVSALRRVNWRQRLTGVSSSLRSSHSRRSTASPMKSSADMPSPLRCSLGPLR